MSYPGLPLALLRTRGAQRAPVLVFDKYVPDVSRLIESIRLAE